MTADARGPSDRRRVPLRAVASTRASRPCFHWHKVYKLPVNSIRIFNAYGPRVRTTGAYGAVFGVFFRQKLAGKPFTVVGDGTQRRDFVYVARRGPRVPALLPRPTSSARSSTSAPATRSRSIAWSSCSAATSSHVPKRPGEPDCTWADIAKITRELGWQPQVPFEEGVDRMLANIDHWSDAPLWDPDSIEQGHRDLVRYMGNRSRRA